VTKRIASLLFAAARAIAPRGERKWIDAMRAEAGALDDGAKLVWAAGGLPASVRLRLADKTTEFATLAAGLALVIILLDWINPDPDGTIVALSGSSALLAAAFPARRIGIGFGFGLCLFATHALGELTGVRPSYHEVPLTVRELLEVAAVLALTVPAALLGARLPRQAS